MLYCVAQDVSSGILTFLGWTALSPLGWSVQCTLGFVFWLGQELPAQARSLVAVPAPVLAAGMSHTCTLMSLAWIAQLSCALLSLSIPCEPACPLPREAILGVPAAQCHFLFDFPTFLSFPVAQKCV